MPVVYVADGLLGGPGPADNVSVANPFDDASRLNFGPGYGPTGPSSGAPPRPSGMHFYSKSVCMCVELLINHYSSISLENVSYIDFISYFYHIGMPQPGYPGQQQYQYQDQYGRPPHEFGQQYPPPSGNSGPGYPGPRGGMYPGYGPDQDR